MPTRHKGTRREGLVLGAWIKMNRALGVLSGRMEKLTLEYGLTPGQFGLLETLYHLGPLSQKELSQKLFSTDGNICQILGNLEKHALVARERQEEDKRFVTVTLTTEGRALIKKTFPLYLKALQSEMSVLSDVELETLSALAKKLGLGLNSEK